MKKKRYWRQWPKRFKEAYEGALSLTSVGGILLAAGSYAGFTFAHGGLWAIGIGSVGTILLVGTTGWAAIKAVPPELVSPHVLSGKAVGLEQLANIYPPIQSLSIVGPSMAGKSTLVNMVQLRSSPAERTQSVQANIVRLQSDTDRHLAFIDGGGQMLADQFSVASKADFLCILLDHTTSDNDQDINEDRLKEHNMFSEQLRGYLSSERKARLKWVHLLVNKCDLLDQQGNRQRMMFPLLHGQ